MYSRKKFLRSSAVAGLGLLAFPLKALAGSTALTAKETDQLKSVIDEMHENLSEVAYDFRINLRPARIVSRASTADGYKTTYRAVNGQKVVLEDFGRPVVRFY